MSSGRCLVLFFAFLSGFAHAEQVALDGIENPERLRLAIETERVQKVSEFDRLERECYQKFAVNDCIKKVNQQRTQEISELKRRLEVLESAARMQRATEQMQRLEQKKREQEQRDLENSTKDAALQREKQEQQQQKKNDNLKKSEAQVVAAPKEKKPTLSRTQSINNQQAYQKKLEEAEKRKAERNQRMSERDATVKGLPRAP